MTAIPFQKPVLDEVRAAAATAIGKRPELSEASLAKQSANFRRRFGPDVLRDLQGEELLETLHGADKNSLAYWLEFKNDDEFVALSYGSIAGGSAYKFGIFRRRETGEWTAGSSHKPLVLRQSQAEAYAAKQRDDLLAMTRLIEELPLDAEQDRYSAFEADVRRAAPSICDLAWSHKYLSVLYPEKLDDIHAEIHQQYHIVRLLTEPPPGGGRYANAGVFADLRRQLGLHMGGVTAGLYQRSGGPHAYWRVGTSDGSVPQNRWAQMSEGSYVAIGWEKIGDLVAFAGEGEGKQAIAAKVRESYGSSPQEAGREAAQLWDFFCTMQPRDTVVAMDGKTVLGVAEVVGEYRYAPDEPFPHRRDVRWLSRDEWKMENPPLLRSVMRFHLVKHAPDLVAAESRILGVVTTPKPPTPAPAPIETTPSRVAPTLKGVAGRLQAILDRKLQAILFGPPGTGKTYWAKRTARDLAAYDRYGKSYAGLADEEKRTIDGPDGRGAIRFCTFHPAYGYEDFVEGFRPVAPAAGGMGFELRDGIFKSLCRDAAADPQRRYFLIVDEINRGDVPRIFGELLTLLEEDKRVDGPPVTLPLSKAPFRVPKNLFVIGTMNTADRSIALLDAALRRRFGFVELMPDPEQLGATTVEGIPLAGWLAGLNAKIRRHVGRDARNLQIGHAYLMSESKPVASLRQFAAIVRDDVVPLLEEYCYEDYSALAEILGVRLIDKSLQRVRDEIFEAGQEQALVQALMEVVPELSRSNAAIDAESAASEAEPGDADSEASAEDEASATDAPGGSQ